MSMKFISIRSTTKRAKFCTYIGSTWCTCVLPLQPYRDITSVLFCRLINVDILLLFLTIFICYKRNARQLTYTCTCTVHVAALPWYNICTGGVKIIGRNSRFIGYFVTKTKKNTEKNTRGFKVNSSSIRQYAFCLEIQSINWGNPAFFDPSFCCTFRSHGTLLSEAVFLWA